MERLADLMCGDWAQFDRPPRSTGPTAVLRINYQTCIYKLQYGRARCGERPGPLMSRYLDERRAGQWTLSAADGHDFAYAAQRFESNAAPLVLV